MWIIKASHHSGLLLDSWPSVARSTLFDIKQDIKQNTSTSQFSNRLTSIRTNYNASPPLLPPKGMYSPEDKAGIAAASLFVGGKRNDKFLRITAEHIARNFSDDIQKRAFMDRYEQALAPFTKD
ncbi:hypothetical protein C8R44DRAFT_864863 [Mycena epipterygia]|nr:hypothetical protein C8R44DRAFT_864863 [Mycena epipterygia]